MPDFSAKAIQAQLDRIMANPDFVNGPKLGQFLSYVVGQTLKGRQGKIKQYTIAVEGLGFDKAFDPTNNTSIRIMAGRVRRALERYYANQGAADPIRIDIPKGSYIPVFTDNTSVTETTDSSESASPIPSQIPHDRTEPTIAVFEFECLNNQEEHDFIARGLTWEILASLTRFNGLTVIGPLVEIRDQSIDCRKLRREYGAIFALRGLIRSYGSIIRITIELIDGCDESSPWSRTFEFNLEKTSLLMIEDEVTSRVVGVISDGLGIIFSKIQSESYQKYLKLNDITTAVLAYNNAWMTHATRDFECAIEAVNTALINHPRNALLIALQANLYYGEAIHEWHLLADAVSLMEELANKAISLDPDLQIAQYNLVVINAFFGRTRECVEQARKVVAMNPYHARILAGCGVATTTAGAYELGLELIERARQLNPQFPGWYYFPNYLINFSNEHFDQAWADAQLIDVRGLLWHPLLRAAVLGKLGRANEAKPFTEELLQIKPDFPQRPREYIRHLFVTDEHVDMIWDGLVKAGIQD